MSVTSWIRRQFKNGVSVTDYVPAGFSDVATSFVLADGSSFPDGGVGPFILTIDEGLATEEKILALSRSGSTITVASSGRGYNGTSAQVHGANASVLHTIDAQDMDEANQVAHQTLGAIQANGDLLVGSAANTLTRLAKGSNPSFLQSGAATVSWVAFGASESVSVGTSNSDGTSIHPARADHHHVGVTSFNGTSGAITAVGSFNTRTGAVVLTEADVESVFAAKGGILVGTGAATGEELATGTTGQGLVVGGADASGLEWRKPIVVVQYNPGTQGSYTLGGAFGDVDGTNLAITFTAPPSGNVLISAEFFAACAAGAAFQVGLREASSQVGSAVIVDNATGATNTRRHVEFYITGLTPGASHTYKLAAGSFSGFATTIFVGGNGTGGNVTNNAGPAILKAMDA